MACGDLLKQLKGRAIKRINKEWRVIVYNPDLFVTAGTDAHS